MGCPGLADFRLDVGEDLDTWWGYWNFVEVIAAVDLFPCGELGVDAGTAEEVEGQLSLRDCLVPKVHGELVISAPPTCGKMVLGGSDGALCCIAAVVVGRDKLVGHLLSFKVILEELWAFIV
jgi:hypothetical protein